MPIRRAVPSLFLIVCLQVLATPTYRQADFNVVGSSRGVPSCWSARSHSCLSCAAHKLGQGVEDRFHYPIGNNPQRLFSLTCAAGTTDMERYSLSIALFLS